MRAYWRMIRPVNCGIAALSVGLGYYCTAGSGEFLPGGALLLLALSAFCITGFGNTVNDLMDRDTDAVNRPDRPLPSGAVSVRAAFHLSNLLCLAGLCMARAVSARFFLMALAVAALLWAYNAWLKRTVLAGNLAVSLLTGFTLVYGGGLAADWRPALWPALFAFLLNLAREIVKDMADVAGDRANGCATLPVLYGSGWAANVTAGVLLAVIFLVPRAYQSGLYNLKFLIIAQAGVVLPAFVLVLLVYRNRERAAGLNRISLVLKGMMLAGLIAILAGKI